MPSLRGRLVQDVRPSAHRAPAPPVTCQRRAGRTKHVQCAAADDGPPPRRGLRILETAGGALPLQGVLVKTARSGWTAAWKTMVTELAPQDSTGGFARPASTFPGPARPQDWPLADPGLTPGHLRLYLGNACPWCHRVAIAAYVRGYATYSPASSAPSADDGLVSITRLVDDPARARRGGWALPPGRTDPLTGSPDLKGVYDALNGRPYSGRCTAPLLVDARSRSIVSNDSAAIMAALDAGPAVPGVTTPIALRPPALVPDIDALNADMYARVCNGVYKCGFATSAGAYEAAAAGVAAGLAAADARLATTRFLLGEKFTDADARLLPTIVRLDAVYGPLFRATAGPLAVLWPNVAAWAADCWRLRVAGGGGPSLGPATVDIEGARASYYASLFPLNPSGILPIQPAGVGWFESVAGVRAAEGRGGVGVDDVFFVR